MNAMVFQKVKKPIDGQNTDNKVHSVMDSHVNNNTQCLVPSGLIEFDNTVYYSDDDEEEGDYEMESVVSF